MSTESYSPATMAEFTQDEYGVVHNSAGTYLAAASVLLNHGRILMGWTDDAMTHMDVLLAVVNESVGPLNRMDARPRKLIVAVASYGMFGFAIHRDDPLHHAYLGEKLGLRPSPTTEALADLVNGVIAAMTAEVAS